MDQEQRQKYIQEYEELMKSGKNANTATNTGGNKGNFEITNDKNKNFVEPDNEDPERKMAHDKETFQQFIQQREVPKKAVFLAFTLMIVGIVLIIIGTVKAINAWEPQICLIYWGAGLLSAIPGVFFSCKVYKAYQTKDLGARRSILNDIPDM